MTDGEIHEVLLRARTSVATGEFVFDDWQKCTCGHIYGAAVGGRRSYARNQSSVYPASDTAKTDPRYATVIMEVARLLGADGSVYTSVHRSAAYVSDQTWTLACASMPLYMSKGLVNREAAMEIIERALAELDAREQAAMRAVAAWATPVEEEGRVVAFA